MDPFLLIIRNKTGEQGVYYFFFDMFGIEYYTTYLHSSINQNVVYFMNEEKKIIIEK